MNRQETIYKTFMGWKNLDSKHRFHKKNALNCGDPKCVICGNPRKFFGEKTLQERRFECRIIIEDGE